MRLSFKDPENLIKLQLKLYENKRQSKYEWVYNLFSAMMRMKILNVLMVQTFAY